jgi:hypothetical protein
MTRDQRPYTRLRYAESENGGRLLLAWGRVIFARLEHEM